MGGNLRSITSFRARTSILIFLTPKLARDLILRLTPVLVIASAQPSLRLRVLSPSARRFHRNALCNSHGRSHLKIFLKFSMLPPFG
jgi:hypothetical protein